MEIKGSNRVMLEGVEVRLLAKATEDCSFFDLEEGPDGVLFVVGYNDAMRSQVHRYYKIIGVEIFEKDPYTGRWREMYNLYGEEEETI